MENEILIICPNLFESYYFGH